MHQPSRNVPVSIGTICDRFKEPLHRVRYAIESRGIKAVGRGGAANLYDEEQVAQVGKALREIREARGTQADTAPAGSSLKTTTPR